MGKDEKKEDKKIIQTPGLDALGFLIDNSPVMRNVLLGAMAATLGTNKEANEKNKKLH